MIIVFTTALLILIIISIVIICIESFYTLQNPCCASILYDKCVPLKKHTIDNLTNNKSIINELLSVLNDQPFIYRQAFLISFIESLLMTNFFYAMISEISFKHFFIIFFMLFLFNSFVYAFVQYHYYKQKYDIIEYGLNKIQ